MSKGYSMKDIPVLLVALLALAAIAYVVMGFVSQF
jgi:hypothetical protein